MDDTARVAVADALARLLPRFGVPVESHTVAAPAGRLHYLAAGQGSRVVLLHAGYGGGGNWYRTLGPLARHCRVLAPDRPGHGLSDGDPTTLAHDWLDALAAAEDAPLTALVGHVSGAAVALARAQAQPAGLRALVLSDPELAAPDFATPAGLRGGRPARRVESWYPRLAARFHDRRLLAPEYLYYLWCLAQARPGRDERPPGLAAPGPVPWPAAGERTWPALPLLLLWSRGNRWAPPVLARGLRERLPDARLVVIEQSKGSPQLEQPGEYN